MPTGEQKNVGRGENAMSSPLPDDVAWSIFERMLLIRRFEEAVLRLSYEKQFVGH